MSRLVVAEIVEIVKVVEQTELGSMIAGRALAVLLWGTTGQEEVRNYLNSHHSPNRI